MKLSELKPLEEEIPIYSPRLTRSPGDHLADMPGVPMCVVLAVAVAVMVVLTFVGAWVFDLFLRAWMGW